MISYDLFESCDRSMEGKVCPACRWSLCIGVMREGVRNMDGIVKREGFFGFQSTGLLTVR